MPSTQTTRPSAQPIGRDGKVTIAKEIRDALGIKPGSVAVQRLVDDHIELRIYPAEHQNSLRGILAKTRKHRVPPEDWDERRRRAWPDAVRAEWSDNQQDE